MAHLVGRLRPGVTLDAATTEVRALGPQFGRLFPWRMPDSHGTDVGLRTWREERLGEVRPTLLLLLGAVVAVWLIGTVNLTNLQQVRAAARRPELALRTALGAGRGRVAKQLLTESSLLGLFGGAAGLAVAHTGVPTLVALVAADVPRAEGIRVNGLVLCFAAIVSLGTALAAGTLPALRAARLGHTATLAGLRGIVGGASGRRLGIFVTAEIAAAVMLVISAVLLARSLAVQVGVDVGLSGDRLVAAEVAPSPVRHPNDAVRLDFYASLERRLRALPFVGGVGLSTTFQPFGAVRGGSVFRIEGRPNPATEGGEWPWADLRTAANADFVRTLDVSIIAGRPFTESDVSGAQRVVLISQRLAETWWPEETAVGQRIAFPGSERDTAPWRTVVGVVADVRWQGPASEGTTLYLPLAQHVGAIDAMTLIVQSSGDPTLVADSLRAVVASLNSETPVSRIRAVDDVMAPAVRRPRFTTALVLGFAVLGVVLGMLGVYGVVAYTAARQQRHRHSARARRDALERPCALRSAGPRVCCRWDRHRGGRGRSPHVVAVLTALRRRSVGSAHVRGSTGPVRRACRGRRVASRSSRNEARSGSDPPGGVAPSKEDPIGRRVMSTSLPIVRCSGDHRPRSDLRSALTASGGVLSGRSRCRGVRCGLPASGMKPLSCWTRVVRPASWYAFPCAIDAWIVSDPT